VTREEIDFLVGISSYKQWSGSRVELNALTSRAFIDWLEAKFKEHGVEKVIPDKETLDVAWQRALMIAKVNEAVDKAAKEFKKKHKAKKRRAPRDLAKRLRDLLGCCPELPWDKGLVKIARDAGGMAHNRGVRKLTDSAATA